MYSIMKLLLVFCVCNVLVQTDAYKVLLNYAIPIRSINILGAAIARSLVKAGHEVIFVAAYPPKEKLENLEIIDLSSNQNLYDGDENLSIKHFLETRAVQADMTYLQNKMYINAINTFQNKNLQEMVEKHNHFDVVISDFMETELYAGFAALYNCPMIWVYSMGAHWVPLRLIDAPAHPAYSMDYLSPNAPPFTFSQRVEQLWTQIKWLLAKEYTTLPKEEALFREFFGPLFSERGLPLPNYRELMYNASLILSNDHYAVGNVPATPQNFKFIGGIHIQTPTSSLPQDLQALMDNATHGVIYFSMGSTWLGKDFPSYVKQDLLKMFGELKQIVIWKHEDPLENVPKNVHILNWVPQPSILAHPNLLFFITHGGLLSSTEAIHFGVPVISVPIYFDQFVNTNKAVKKGFALAVELNKNLADNLRKAIQVMSTDQRYKAKVKELSKIYHDRVLPAERELVYSVEHVIRTGGASHLRSPGLHVPLYQKLYLDLLAVIFVGLFVVYKALRSIFRLIHNQIRSKKKID